MAAAAKNGKNQVVASSGKVVANPEVGSSGKSNYDDLPLTDETDLGIELEEQVSKIAKGWRLEQNSNSYWRWRWQLKDNDGQPVTYVNSSGNTGYKRGSEYVPINELEKAKKEAGL